jgi:peroxiredoxin
VVVALVLLGVFSCAIGWNLMRGRTPDCHCFGQLHSAPATWKTLARNGALLGLAGFALATTVAGPPASALSWTGRPESSELLALGVAVAVAAVLALGVLAFLSLLRSYGAVLVRLDRVEAALAEAGIELEDEALPEIGLEPGTPAPAFWATSLTGETVSTETLAAAERPSLLLFTSSRCGPCKTLLPQAAEWQRALAGELDVVLVSHGPREEVEAEVDEHGLEHVLLDEDRHLYDAFQANGTPSAVLVAPGGMIGSWVASGAEWIEQLVGDAMRRDGGLPVGEEAPVLELPSLDGETVSLASLRGREAVLLFWNPECGFCRSMHDDLVTWEATANGVTPRLVIVSSGDAETTRAEGFDSLVLLDEEFAAGTAFEAGGTPMAVLVDADGRVASPVVAGADAVLGLAAHA